MSRPSATTSSQPAGLRRGTVAGLIFALVLTALALSWARGAQGRRLAGEGRWIWADGLAESGFPVAFLAVRDFALAELPLGAQLRIVADEAYLVQLNGWQVGSGSYREGDEIDVYAVEDLLQVGANRLLVQLRSSRGAGGLLATLEADGEALLVSDRSWRIFRDYSEGVARGWSSLDAGQPAVEWGRPPTGRWRPSGLGEALRPLALTAEPRVSRPHRSRAHYAGSRWHQPPVLGRRLPELGQVVLFDFRHEVSGYLRVRLPAGGGDTALVFYGLEPPDLEADRPDEILIPMPGAESWRSAVPRRFRYVLVAGLPLRRPVQVEPLPAALAGRLATSKAPRGVFGLAPIRQRSRVEEAVWKRLAPPGP